MKQFLVVALAVVTTWSAARANLGDGYEKVEDSYGNIVQRRLRDDGTVSVLFHKDRYLYFVIFADGRSVLERYSNFKGTDLSEREIAKFLKLNAARGTWNPVNTSKGRRFVRSDGKAEATYGKTDGNPGLTVREAGRRDDE
jgi:hypothetical protein